MIMFVYGTIMVIRTVLIGVGNASGEILIILTDNTCSEQKTF